MKKREKKKHTIYQLNEEGGKMEKLQRCCYTTDQFRVNISSDFVPFYIIEPGLFFLHKFIYFLV